MTTFSCTNITRRYKNFCLDNVSFSMETGYFYVLAGVNGSGKTTLLDCIAGVDNGFPHSFLGNAQIGDVSLKTSPEAYARDLVISARNARFFWRNLSRRTALLTANSIQTGQYAIILLISVVWVLIRRKGYISFPKGNL